MARMTPELATKIVNLIGDDLLNPPTKETLLSKTNNPQEGNEQQSNTLWIAVHLANGEMRPVRIQWGEEASPSPLVATIYNNVDTMARIKTH